MPRQLLLQHLGVPRVVLHHLLEELLALLVALGVLQVLLIGSDRLQLVVQRRDEILGQVVHRLPALAGRHCRSSIFHAAIRSRRPARVPAPACGANLVPRTIARTVPDRPPPVCGRGDRGATIAGATYRLSVTSDDARSALCRPRSPCLIVIG